MRAGQDCYVVQDENPYASGHKKRPRGPRSTRTVQYTSNLDTIPQRPLIDLKSEAIVYYLQYHMHTLKDASNMFEGVSYVFLPFWTSGAECPILDLALSSIALAVFSRTRQHPPAAIEASMKYHRLLQIMQQTVISLDEGNIGVCLLAIHFMSRYEQVVYRPSHLDLKTPFATRRQSFSHHDGALAILKIWKDHLSHSEPVTDVIKHTRRGMIRSAILRNLALPEWILDGTTFGEHGLELDYDCIIVRIVDLRHRLSELLKETGTQGTSPELASVAEELNKEAQDIDKSLQDWRAQLPSSWRYQQQHTLTNPDVLPARDFYSPMVFSYSSPACAAVWNQYYSMGMLITSTRLRILKLCHLSSDDFAHEQQQLECVSRMKFMGNDLASTVPFCLQRFKVIDNPNPSSHPQNLITLNANEEIRPRIANLAIWPLSLASCLEYVDVDQKLWFRSELARLGRMVGDTVLECAETGLLPEL